MKAVIKLAYWQLRSHSLDPDAPMEHSPTNYVEARLLNAIHYDMTHDDDTEKEQCIIDDITDLYKQGINIDDISDMLEIPSKTINKMLSDRSKIRCR